MEEQSSHSQYMIQIRWQKKEKQKVDFKRVNLIVSGLQTNTDDFYNLK